MGGLYKWFGVCCRLEFNSLTYTNMRTTAARSVEGLGYLLTYSMEQRPSREANRYAASQIPRILCNPKLYLNIIPSSTPGSAKWSLSAGLVYLVQSPAGAEVSSVIKNV
jgi:hypothetical protein